MGGNGNGYKIFAGNSNLALAQAVCAQLERPLCKATVSRFSDGEIQVEIGENVRGADTFVIQSTCRDANENLMELLIMTDALKRASAGSIMAVIPYYGYARQDRKVAPRTPITAKLVADLIEAAGATRVVSMDMHAGQIQGFFNIPFDHLYAAPVLLDAHEAEASRASATTWWWSRRTPAASSARAPTRSGSAPAWASSTSGAPSPNVAEVMNVIGDVQGKVAILLDDMIDTAGTLTQAANALVDKGASRVFAYATHAVLSGPAVERIQKSPIEEIVVTDTIPLTPTAQALTKIKQLPTARLFAEAVKRIYNADSLSSLFV